MTDKTVHKFPIKITNFINPHVFHFKLEHIVGQVDVDTETRLRRHADAIKMMYPSGYPAKEGEMVSVFIFEWRKWVRGQVDFIFQEMETKQYIVWCVDHGVSMKLTSNAILPMPAELQAVPSTVFLGGLAKCMPVEKRLNFVTMSHETRNLDDFSEYLVTNAKRLLEESEEVYFIPRQKYGDHIFGDIEVIAYAGTKMNFLKQLLTAEGAREDANVIPDGIEELKTMNKQRYEDQRGILNIQTTGRRPQMTTYDPKMLKNQEQQEATQTKEAKTIGGKSENEPTMECNMVSKSGTYNESVVSVYSTDMYEEDRLISHWCRQNNEEAKKLERDSHCLFYEVIQHLDTYVSVPKETKPKPFHHFLGSMDSFACSSQSHLSQYGSQSFDVAEKSFVMKNSRIMNKLAEKMKAASINSDSKPEERKGFNKVAYIPSGFERDLVDFHKYNF